LETALDATADWLFGQDQATQASVQKELIAL
jgi:hypothetical protein